MSCLTSKISTFTVKYFLIVLQIDAQKGFIVDNILICFVFVSFHKYGQ